MVNIYLLLIILTSQIRSLRFCLWSDICSFNCILVPSRHISLLVHIIFWSNCFHNIFIFWHPNIFICQFVSEMQMLSASPFIDLSIVWRDGQLPLSYPCLENVLVAALWFSSSHDPSLFALLVRSHSRPVTSCWDWTSQRCSAAWLLWIKWLQVSQHLNTCLSSGSYMMIVGIPQPGVCGCWVQTAGLMYLYLILSVQISAWAAIRCLPDTLHPTVLSLLSRCPVRRPWAGPPSCCKTNFAVW